VIEKRDPARKPGITSTVKVDAYKDLRLLGIASDLCSAHGEAGEG
jgi:hypothetical protein